MGSVDLSEETISTMEWGADSDDGHEAVVPTESAGASEPLGWLPRTVDPAGPAGEMALELGPRRPDSPVPRLAGGRLRVRDLREASGDPLACRGTQSPRPDRSIDRADAGDSIGDRDRECAGPHDRRPPPRLRPPLRREPAPVDARRMGRMDFPDPPRSTPWIQALRRVEDRSPADTLATSSPGKMASPVGYDRWPGPDDLTLDRVGPDPFVPSGLGPIVTIRWAVRVGTTVGAVRLWLPESVVERWLESPPRFTPPRTEWATESGEARGADEPERPIARGELASQWRAEAGSISMPQGLRRLRAGGVLPLTDCRLVGTPGSPAGPVNLILDLDGQGGRFRIPVRPLPDSGGRLVRIEGGLHHEPRPRDPILVNVKENRPMNSTNIPPNPPSPAPEIAPLDVPVTLTVELGRVNLTLSRLADLKPGDVIELSRHSPRPSN